jgi:hypothetical protein
VPADLVRAFDRDIAVADIPKRDERGRTLDVHALRHTFGTHLSKGGVAPRTTQAVMRHSVLELTMNTYTDPKLLDVAGALDVFPELPLDDRPHTERQQATETDGRRLVPGLVPNAGNCCTSGALAGQPGNGRSSGEAVIRSCADTSSAPESSAVRKRAKGLEPSTTSLEGRTATTVSSGCCWRSVTVRTCLVICLVTLGRIAPKAYTLAYRVA